MCSAKTWHASASHPDILLSISAKGRQISLSHRDSDVALRLVRLNEASKLGGMPVALYAHRDHVHLSTPQQWRFIAFDPRYEDLPQQRWLLGIAADHPVACDLNFISEHLIAARAGIGVAAPAVSVTERSSPPR